MNVKLLTEHHLEFQSLEGGCTGSSESTLIKMPHCSKSHVTAHMYFFTIYGYGWYPVMRYFIETLGNRRADALLP